MRILVLSPVGIVGGAELVLLDVLASLRPVLPAGSSIHMICLGVGPMADAARAIGVNVEVIPLPARLEAMGESGIQGGKVSKTASLASRLMMASPSAVAFVRKFRRAALACNADIIHSNGVKTHLLSRLLPAKAGHVVWHVHDLLGSRALMSGMLKYAAGRLGGAVAISQAVANDLKSVLPRSAVFTVLNGIDTSHFKPDDIRATQNRNSWDALAGFSTESQPIVRVGLIATYARWKGQDVFLQAIAQLGDLTAVRFFIVGGSIYHTAGSQFSRAELEQQATALGVRERVGFVDFQADPAPIYRALDIIVHASTKPEPFGRTIVEGMASAKAVIVSAAGGAVELFTDDVDALGTMPGDVEQLAKIMRRLIGDEALRERLGTAARQTAVVRFDRARLGAEMLAVYEAVANR